MKTLMRWMGRNQRSAARMRPAGGAYETPDKNNTDLLKNVQFGLGITNGCAHAFFVNIRTKRNIMHFENKANQECPYTRIT